MSIFGWSLPPGCTSLPGEDDDRLDNELLKESFDPLASLHAVHTATQVAAPGATVGALLRWWEGVEFDEPLIEWHGDEPVQVGTSKACTSEQSTAWLHGDELRQLGDWPALHREGKLVLALSVSFGDESGEPGPLAQIVRVGAADVGDAQDLCDAWARAIATARAAAPAPCIVS